MSCSSSQTFNGIIPVEKDHSGQTTAYRQAHKSTKI